LSSNTNIGNTPVNQGYVQLVHMGETGGIDGTLRTLYDGDGTASDLQIASNKVKISTELYIGSKTIAEYVQDVVGDMFDTNGSHTNITATYDDDGDGAIDLVSTGEVTLTGTQTLSNKTLASPTLTGTAAGANLTLSGDLTVNGTTIAVDQTNLDVSDNIIGLNRGASSNINDSGLIIERGSTGDNAAIIWDEAVGRFKLGTTTATPSSTGSISVSTGTLVASLAGNATSASSATTANALSTAGTLTFTGDVVGGTTPTYTSGGNLSIAMAIQPNSVALSTDTTGNYVGTITASSGLSSTGATSGEGIAHSISVNAGQVGITSIYNSSLKIGTASDGQIIDFNTSDEIRLGSSTQATVKIKTDPLGSAQDEVIIGDGSYDVDFVVDGSGGSTIFKVDAGTGNTAVTGDLSISGSFSPATVTASTSVRTPLIEFTDGDDAITIANGGGMTFAKGFTVTSGASSFGANVAIKNTGGTTLQLNTSSTDVDETGVLGRINFSAPDEFAGSDSNLLAASIVAQATADFTASSNKTDMIFQLGVSETASEKFRIVSDGKIKIGGSYTLPSSDGSANQVLKTNGSGTLSFADASTGAVTALNNATANELVTVGSTTTELDAEANLTFDGSTLEVNGGLEISPAEPTIHLNRGNGSYSWKIINGAGTGSFPLSTFNIANNAGTPVITALDSGNVGIGTTSPSDKLEIAGPHSQLRLTDSDDGQYIQMSLSSDALLFRHNTTSGTAAVAFKDDGSVGIGTNSPTAKLDVRGNVSFFSSDASDFVSFTHSDNGIIINSAGSTSNKMALNTGGTTALTIDASQNVGIGTDAPGYKLDVSGDYRFKDTASGGALLGYYHNDSNNGLLLLVYGSTYSGGSVLSVGANGTAYHHSHTVGINAGSGSDIKFGAGGTEKFRMESDGDFHASNDVVAYSTTPSDKKLKTNVKDINYGLDTIMKLNPKQYDWKKDNRHDIGFIAQEVEEVIPEIVKDKEWFDDKIKTLDYEKLTAVLIKAVQEQQKQIEELKNG